MVKKLYMVWGSPPVNSVLMTAKALNVDLELREMDFAKNEYMEEWFININPSHTVPTLDDDGFILWDSQAIVMYLVETYGKESNLYWSDSKEKYKILQILNLNCGTVFRKLITDCLRPIFYDDKTILDPIHLKEAKEVYIILEKILETNEFLASNNLTIADISVFCCVVVGNMFLPIAQEEFPLLKRWLQHIQSLDLYEAAAKGVETLKQGLIAKIGLKV